MRTRAIYPAAANRDLVLTHPYAEPRYDAPARSRSEASAANGPDWAARGVAARCKPNSGAGRLRRRGKIMDGAGGPYSSGARLLAGKMRKPRQRSTTGISSAFTEKREAEIGRQRHRTSTGRPAEFGADPLRDVDPQ